MCVHVYVDSYGAGAGTVKPHRVKDQHKSMWDLITCEDAAESAATTLAPTVLISCGVVFPVRHSYVSRYDRDGGVEDIFKHHTAKEAGGKSDVADAF